MYEYVQAYVACPIVHRRDVQRSGMDLCHHTGKRSAGIGPEVRACSRRRGVRRMYDPGSVSGATSAYPQAPGSTAPHLTPAQAQQILAGELRKVIAEIHTIAELIGERQRGDYETTFYIPAATGSNAAAPLSYEGKRHLLIWTPASIAGVSLAVPGIGTQSGITIAAGWTVFDPPRGSYINATTATTVKIRCTDNVPAGLY